MDCEKCKIKMMVENTYRADGQSITQRHRCRVCNSICTSVTIRVFKHPVIGQGAYSLAQQMKKDIGIRMNAAKVFENGDPWNPAKETQNG